MTLLCLAPDTNTVAEDTPATGNVLSNDSDVDNVLSVATFTVNGTTVAAGQTTTIAGVGTITIAVNGDYTFTPDANWNGTVPTVTYTTNTGSSSTLDITVTPVDDASVLAPDTNTVAEDTPATGNVLSNDSDVDNALSVATFTVNGTTVAAGQTTTINGVGTITVAANGDYVFTPVLNFNGTVPTVTYTTNTGSSSTLDITVTPVDDASVLAPDTNTVAEDTPATGNVLSNDSDVDNVLSVATFTVNGTTVAAGQTTTIAGVGTITIAVNGDYTFTPDANWNGTVPTVTYTTNTGSNSTLDITVTPVDDASVLAPDTNTVAEDTPATGNVLANDSDVDNVLSVATFTVNGTTVAAGQTTTLAGVGTITVAANGDYVFTPVLNFNGTVPTVTYTTNTGSSSTLDITVTPVDDASVLAPDTNTVAEDTPATGNVLSNDSDVDNVLSVATFTVGGTTVAAGQTTTIAGVGTITIAVNGDYTFTPDANWNGTVPTVTYTTNTGSSSTLNITVTPVDDASVLAPDTNTVAEDTPATGNVLSNDSDVDNVLSVATFTVNGTTVAAGQTTSINGVGTITVAANGDYVFTPVLNFNGTVPTVTYTTNTGSSSTLDITVTPVDDASVLAPDTNTVAEDTPATGNVLSNDSDVDNVLSVATFTVGGTTVAAGQTTTIAGVGTITIAVNGDYTFTPDANWNGTVPTVTYTTNTGSSSTLDITVTPVNDPSVLQADVNIVPEDTPATGNVLANDVDVDDVLSVTSFTVGGTTVAAGQTTTIAGVGTITIAVNGDYTFTPDANWNGTVPTVTYTTNTGSSSTLDITVTPVNNPSVLVADTNTVAEDSPATGNVLSNDSDVDDVLSVASFTVGGVTVAAGQTTTVAGVGTITIAANGDYTFTPVANWNGTVPTITYTTNTGSSSTLDITVTPVDDASVLAPDTNTVAEDTPATGNVLSNDSDVDNVLSVATFTVGGTTVAAGQTTTIAGVGTITIAVNGDYTFTPDANWNGTVPTVTYTTNTGSSSTLDITVTPVDDASVLAPDTNTVAEDTPATGNVLSNDSDVDNVLSVATFTVNGTTVAAGQTTSINGVGTITVAANGDYVFTPVLNFNGTVPTVTYTTNTGSSSTLDITVTPVDDASVLAPDTNTVAEDTPATGNVLSNDSDVDNVLSVATFTVNGVTGTFNAGQTATIAGIGTITIAANGNYTFTPVKDWNGSVPVINYTTNTGSSTTLTITVTPVDDPSVLVADTKTVAEDTVATGNVLTNDTDVDNVLSVATFTVNGVTGTFNAGQTATIAGIGTIRINANGDYTFTPVQDWNGSVPVINYTTNTGSSTTLTITVTPVDDPSVLVADTKTILEDTVATGNVLTNDSDVDNVLSVATFTVNGTTVAAGQTTTIAGVGTITIAANGNYTFTPVQDWNGTVPVITYTTNTGSSTTLTITVTPVDDPSILVADTKTVLEDTVATGNVLTNDTDVDNVLSVATFTVNGVTGTFNAGQTATIAGIGTITIAANGNYTFTPVQDWNGSVPVINYTTNTGSSTTLTITVTPVDDPSVLVADTKTVAEDTVATGNVLTNDTDVDNVLSVATFTVNGVTGTFNAGQTATIAGIGTITIAANGNYTFTPVQDWNGSVPVINYTTNTGSSTTLTITVTPVDDPSVLVADTKTILEDTVATGNVLTNDSDVDNVLSVATFTVNGTTVAAGQTTTIAGVGSITIAANGNYTFTPVQDWNGTVPVITYTTNTGSSTTLTITVTPVDDPSILVADTKTVLEDTVATGNVLTNDSDVDNVLSVATFTVNGVTGTFNAGQTATIAGIGTIRINANGDYTFTPVQDWNGSVPVINYTTNTGSSTTLTITVTPVDDPSVLVADTKTILEDTVATGNVLTNDSDVDNVLSVATFTVNGVTGTFNAGQTATIAGIGTIRINANGDYTFTPVQDWNGSVPVINYTTNTGSSTTLTITVTPVDDPSILVADTKTVLEDTVATGNVLTNDSDVDNVLSVATFTVNGVTGTFNAGQTATIAGIGTITIAANGNYTFTPVKDWNGSVPVINYTTNTGSSTTLTITVTPVDDPSVLVADTKTVAEDTVATGNVLTNDSDVDNVLSVATFTVNGVTGTFNAGQTATIAGVGTVNIAANGNYTFTPVKDWNGTVPVINYTTNTGSSTTLTITVTPVNDAPVIVNGSTTVSEEGLPGGLPDSNGNPSDTTDLATRTGTLSITDVDSPVTVTLTAPTTTLTSNGVIVTWSGNGTSGSPLIGSAGGVEVIRATIDNNGAYTVTLSKGVDHPTGQGENVLSFDLGVKATDGLLTTNGTLTVNVEDDSPNAVASTQSVAVPYQDTNIMLVLDISGSMNDVIANTGGQTRLSIMKAAVATMIDQYDNLGDVMVRVVTFSSNAQAYQSVWVTAAQAKTYVNSLTAGGSTNYDAALLTAQTAFVSSGKIVGGTNVSYFLTDGVPTASTDWDGNGPLPNQVGIQTGEEAIWKNFLTNNQINSFAYGMGTGATQAAMDPVAYNGINAVNTNAIIVADVTQLPPILRDSIVTPTGGEIVNGSLGAGSGVGGDGGHLASFVLDGTTYFFGSGTPTGTNHGTYDAVENAWTVSTNAGGKFVVDMDTSQYTYTPPVTTTAAFNEGIGYTLIDNDGDTASSTLTINVLPPQIITLPTGNTSYTGTDSSEKIIGSDGNNTIYAGGGNDSINGGAGADYIVGGKGNDIMTGGLGSDTFAWKLADHGTPGVPERDIIVDFDTKSAGTGGDVLDLRDLLQGENSANLTNYLHFTTSNGSTVINISSTGAYGSGFADTKTDQIITLNGVTLSGASDTLIIQNLITNGKLIVD